jgi:hypothetical protein
MGFGAVEVSIFGPEESGKTISLFVEGVREFCENPFHLGCSQRLLEFEQILFELP